MGIENLMNTRGPVSGGSDFRAKLLAYRALPSGTPDMDLRAASTFGTSTDLTQRQESTERGARRETARLEEEFRRIGRYDEYEDVLARQGEVSIPGRADAALETSLNPIIDMLSIGEHTGAGYAHELMRTDSAWEALKQAGIEFGDSLPFVEIDGAKKLTYNDLFIAGGASKWEAASAGLVMAMVLDPLNWVPGVAAAKGASRVGRSLIEKSGALGKGIEKYFLGPKFGLRGLGDVGDRVIEMHAERTALSENAITRLQDEMDELFQLMTPEEEVLLGAFGDSGRLNLYLEQAADAGIIAGGKDRAKELFDLSQQILERSTKEFKEEVSLGLMDDKMFHHRYMHAAEGQPGKRTRTLQKVIDERTPTSSVRNRRSPSGAAGQEMFPTGRMSAVNQKEYSSIEERLAATLSGDLTRTTELSIKNITQKRSVDHIRWMNTKLFLDDVLNDGNIALRVTPDGEILSNPGRYRKYIDEVVEPQLQEGYSVMERTKTVLKDGSKVEEVIGTYVVPTPVKEFVERADAAYGSLDDVGEFMQTIDKMTGAWKGWATFGPGYIMRNMISAWNSNWMAGVGANYGELVKGRWPVPGQFMMKHLQGIRLQIATDGAARIPKGMKKKLDALAGMDIGKLPLPKIKNAEGKLVQSWEELAQIGESVGVPMSATRAYDVPDNIERGLWEELETTVPIKTIEESGLPETVQLALKAGRGERSTWGERLNKVAGRENPLVAASHAFAQMTENTARWALWIDRMEKGASPMAARMSTIQWHYDYRQLTNFEQKFMRRLVPFYSWTRYNVPRMIMATIENPGRISRMPKVKDAIENLAADLGPLPEPDYFDEVQAINLSGIPGIGLHNNRPLYAQLDLPILDLNRQNAKDIAASLHPMTKVFEFLPRGGYSFFLDAPIERFPGEISETTGLAKTTEAALTTMFPPIGKVIRMERAADKGELPTQALSELVGVRMRSLDVRRVVRANTYQRRQLAREFKQRLEQEGAL